MEAARTLNHWQHVFHIFKGRPDARMPMQNALLGPCSIEEYQGLGSLAPLQGMKDPSGPRIVKMMYS